MLQIPFGAGSIPFEEGDVQVLCSRIGELRAEGDGLSIADQWESRILARILKKHTVIMVTRPELKTMVEEMKMRYAASPEEAVAMARAMGKRTLTVIPNGISVIVRE